jgi:chemotaxis protein methyltransferase CheR
MYFTADYTRSIIQKFRRSLLPEGWLLVSPVEAPFVDQSDFSPFLHTGAILHRKVGYKAQACAAPLKLPASRPVNRALPPVEILKPVGDWKRAESIYAQADYASAIKELLALVSRPKAGLEAIMLLSRSYANAGLLGEAERWADEAASVDPMSAGARYLVALIRIEVRRADEAMADLRKAIYLEPDFIMAQYTLSGLYRKKRKFADADRLLRNVTAALRGRGPDEVLPESEGLTVGMLTDLIVAARAEIKTVVHA